MPSAVATPHSLHVSLPSGRVATIRGTGSPEQVISLVQALRSTGLGVSVSVETSPRRGGRHRRTA